MSYVVWQGSNTCPQPQWSYSSATTYTLSPQTATVVLNDVPVAASPKTEVERLMGDVEAVCALAR